jgi:hypothetical protein
MDSFKKQYHSSWFSIDGIKNIISLNCRIYYCKEKYISHGYLRFIILKDLKMNKFYYLSDFAGAEFTTNLNLHHKYNNQDFFDSKTRYDYLLGINDFINDHPELSEKKYEKIQFKSGDYSKDSMYQYKLDKNSKLLDSLLTYTILYSYRKSEVNNRIQNEQELNYLINVYTRLYNVKRNKILNKNILLKYLNKDNAILYHGYNNQILLVILNGSRVLFENGPEKEFLPFYGSFNIMAFSIFDL